MSPTFVVGTGRCGSTMLSRILHLHPDILSLSEFFATLQMDWGKITLSASGVGGQEFWELFSAPAGYVDTLFQAGIEVPEYCYPDETGRFKLTTGVPKICAATLPLLSDDPDMLFDQLADVVPNWPVRPAAEQYHAFFALLAELLGRRAIVERSGNSIVAIPILDEMFPGARFVHMHRNGPDCALSMSRHPNFWMLMLKIEARIRLGLPDTISEEELQAILPARYQGLLIPPFDKERFWAYPLPLTAFGQLWAECERTGVSALRDMSRDSWMDLGYEALLHDSKRELTRLGEFIGVPVTTQWLEAAARLIDPGKPGSAQTKLTAAEFAMLRDACAPGAEAIAELRSGGGKLPCRRPRGRSGCP